MNDQILLKISQHLEEDARRLLTLSGLFRELSGIDYQSQTIRDEARTEAQREQEAFPRDPLAKSMADLVTPKQLGMIRALSREVEVNADEECQKVMKCKTDELSKRAASSFIDHLKGLQSGGLKRAS